MDMHWQQPNTPRAAAHKETEGAHTDAYCERWLSCCCSMRVLRRWSATAGSQGSGLAVDESVMVLSCCCSMRVLRRYSATAGSQAVDESVMVLRRGYTLGREA